LFGLFDGKVEMLDCADDSNKERKMGILYKQLARRGFLEETKGAKGTPAWRLTPMGNEFVTYLREEYNDELATSDEPKRVKEDPQMEDFAVVAEEKDELEILVASWIKEYADLFPKPAAAGGKILRDHPHALISRMKAFVKQYNYDKDTILKATKMYLDEQEASLEGHKYTRTSKYFISKDRGESYISDLATWCKRVTDGEETGGTWEYDTKGMDMV
jgi:hypothetical protein